MKPTKVTLRRKKLSNGKLSLYLDFYPAIPHPTKGSTRREFLKLYIFEKPRTEQERKQNKETIRLAETICAKRQVKIQEGAYGFTENLNKDRDFLQYFKGLAKKRFDSAGNYGNWMSAFRYIEAFSGGTLTFGEIDENFVLKFKAYLEEGKSLKRNGKRLSANSSYSYFNKFKAALNQAFRDKILSSNPASRVKGLKPQETHREYLSLEELQALANTDCELPILKKAAIFSALTGLRWSDISQLKWSNLKYSVAEGDYIRFVQKKTKVAETLPISKQARDLLGEKGNLEEAVFPNLTYSAWNNLKIREWALKAGIQKKITFHSFRHTFATLQLTLGTDIYTVSKLLGHKELRTTQIYTRVIDKKKRDAVDKIPDLEK